MRVPIASLLALLGPLFPAAALAQSTPEGPGKVQQIREVERGFFLQTDLGVGMFVSKLNERDYGLSIVTAVTAGYDIAPIFSLGIGALAVAAPVNRTADGKPSPQGDLLYAAPMLHLQLALVTTERNFLYVRGGAGFGFALPDKIGDKDYGGSGPLFSANVGFEHYTKLRHFSLGLQAGALIVTKPSTGVGITVTPLLKYTF